jgi:hypothetical protein
MGPAPPRSRTRLIILSSLRQRKGTLDWLYIVLAVDRLRDEGDPGAFFHLIAPARHPTYLVHCLFSREENKTHGASIADCEAALVHRLPFI